MRSKRGFVDFPAPDPIQQDMHLDPARRTFRKCLRKLPADAPGPIDIRLKRDRALRGPNGGQHGRKDLITVEQRGDLMSVENGRAE